jgi:hypothetical protein
MKRIILNALLCLITSTSLPAQVTDRMNYQAVARDASGNILGNQLVSIRLTVEDGSGGSALYVETHSATTNQFGLFTLQIGNGSVVSGVYSNIDWSVGNHWLKVEMDPAGGSSYTDMGESQLLSVPYANYAASGGTPYYAGNGIDITSNTISLTNTTVNPGTYGDNVNIPQLTIDAQGRITDAINAPISGFLPAGTSGQTLRHNGSDWIANSNLYNDGSSIGIGTTSPVGLLHLNNPGGTAILTLSHNFNTHIEAANDVANGASLRFYTTASSTTGERMRISSEGMVGIGTTLPEQSLHVNGVIRANSIENDQSNDFEIFSTANTNYQADEHVFSTAFNERMRIDNAGDIGIGFSYPQQKLDVNGAIKIGTTSSNVAGSIRYTGTDFEGYTGGAWQSFTTNKSQWLQGYNYISNVRNTIVYPNDSIVVNESGMYLITFNIRGVNGNSYSTLAPDYDNSGASGVYLVGYGGITPSVSLFEPYQDITGSGTFFRYVAEQGSASVIYQLTAGNVLKVYANITATGAPATNWALSSYSVQIIKIGN